MHHFYAGEVIVVLKKQTERPLSRSDRSEKMIQISDGFRQGLLLPEILLKQKSI